LYGTLHAVAREGRRAQVGFMHVPLSPPMVAVSGLEQPSMDTGLGVRALEVALRVIAEQLAAPLRP
ncbi:MAG TPA: hypothetical protein VNQ15_10125, partial [Verrucomicrobiae bacterium]|nr:hypothetical protein [Verrucomicrobiae bacterium]